MLSTKTLSRLLVLSLVFVTGLESVQVFAAKPMDCRRQLTLRAVTELGFGTLMVSGAGDVVVDTNGARYSNGGVITAGGAVSSSEISVGGCKNYAYNITVQPSTTITNGAASMVVDNLIISPSVGLTGMKGKQSLFLGGTLHVNDAQLAGVYSGSLLIEAIGQ